MTVIFLLLGLVIGGILSWVLLSKQQAAAKQTQSATILLLQQSLEKASQQLSSSQATLQKTQEEKELLIEQKATAETQNKHLQTQLANQKEELITIEERLGVQFRNLANDLLEEKSKKFTDYNQLNLERIIKPFTEKILAFEKKVEETTKDHLLSNANLQGEVRRLSEASASVTKEAEQLARAIKGNNKLQGQWGEIILESVLEKSGLMKDREYFLQESFKEDDKNYRPDVIIKLPENKSIIIDAKMVLVGYERYVNTEEEGGKALYLKQHLQAIRQHIQDLSKKDYSGKYHLQSLDFVLMFIPLEPAFGLAVQKDPTLFQDAYAKNIILVSPTTLLATLRTIANIWKNEYQNRNVLEIAKQGGLLYDKFVGFLVDLKKVGSELKGAYSAYDEAVKKLQQGQGNLIDRAEHLKQLGAKTVKEIPANLFTTT